MRAKLIQAKLSDRVSLKVSQSHFLIQKLLCSFAVLAQVLEPGMGMGTKLAIGLLGMTIDMGWYLIVALALTGTGAVDWLKQRGQLIYRITAVALWVFAASVVLAMM